MKTSPYSTVEHYQDGTPIAVRIGHGTGGQWLVHDHAIVGQQDPPGSGNGGLLLTDQKLANFELTVDMPHDWGPCSEIFFRCTEQGAGFQMYVGYHDRGNVGHLRGEMPNSFAIMPFQLTGTMDGQGRLTGFTIQQDSRTAKWPTGVYQQTCTPRDWLKAWRLDTWNAARTRCQGVHPQITT